MNHNKLRNKRKRNDVAKNHKRTCTTRAVIANKSQPKEKETPAPEDFLKNPGKISYNYLIYSNPVDYHNTPTNFFFKNSLLGGFSVIHCMAFQFKRKPDILSSHLLQPQPTIINSLATFLNHLLSQSNFSTFPTPLLLYLNQVLPKRDKIPPLGNFLLRFYSLMEPHNSTSLHHLSPSQIFLLLVQNSLSPQRQFNCEDEVNLANLFTSVNLTNSDRLYIPQDPFADPFIPFRSLEYLDANNIFI